MEIDLNLDHHRILCPLFISEANEFKTTTTLIEIMKSINNFRPFEDPNGSTIRAHRKMTRNSKLKCAARKETIRPNEPRRIMNRDGWR